MAPIMRDDVSNGDPRISVVIPAYGQTPHLRPLIESLRAQTVQPHELIIAHSGEADPTAWLHDPDKGIIVIHADERWLPGAARNAGAAAAQGDWLAFVDSDVIAEPTWLEGFLAAKRRSDHPTVFVGALNHAAGDGYWGRCMWFIESGSVHPYRASHDMASAPGANLMMAKDIFLRAGGFPTNLLIAEDAQLSTRARDLGCRLLFVPEARAAHHYAFDFRHVMQRLFRLGEGAAHIRLLETLPGSLAARVPPLALGLWLARLALITKRVIENRGPLAKLLVHSPGILLGLVSWSWGFFLGAVSHRADGSKAVRGQV